MLALGTLTRSCILESDTALIQITVAVLNGAVKYKILTIYYYLNRIKV